MRAKAKMIQSGFEMKIFYLNRTEDESGVSGTGRVAQGLGQFGGQMAGLGAQGQQLGQQDISNLLGIGSLYQQQAQSLADAQRATALQQSYEPYQRLGFFSDLLRGVPTTQSSISVGTQPSQSPLSQIAGIAATGLGLAGQLGFRPKLFGGPGLNFVSTT